MMSTETTPTRCSRCGCALRWNEGHPGHYLAWCDQCGSACPEAGYGVINRRVVRKSRRYKAAGKEMEG